MADYPNSLHTHTTLVDGSDYPKAADINLPAAEIIAIETELGTNPKSIDDTVSPGATPASVAAYLDMLANIVKIITGAANWYSAAVAIASTVMTFTNKRITKRLPAVTQSATPTFNTDDGDGFVMTGLAAAITSLTTNMTGTPTEGQVYVMMITDDGTGRAITPGASFVGTSNNTLTGLTTVAGKRLYLYWQYSSALSKWELQYVNQSL